MVLGVRLFNLLDLPFGINNLGIRGQYTYLSLFGFRPTNIGVRAQNSLIVASTEI